MPRALEIVRKSAGGALTAETQTDRETRILRKRPNRKQSHLFSTDGV